MSSPPSSPSLRTSSHKIVRTYKNSAKRKSREVQEQAPKDLSALFDNVGSSPHSSPTTPRKVRRMLTKSESLGYAERKETPEDSPRRPTTPSLGRSASMPSTPSKTPQQETRKVYGRNRSLVEAGPSTKASYAEMRKTYEIEDDLEPARIPKAVSEMRSKGETRQFLDEIGYLADAIADTQTSLALRRSSVLDLLNSMTDVTWVERMDVCGQTDRLWSSLVSARGDEVMDHACLLFLALLIRYESAILQRHEEACTALALEMLRKEGSGPPRLQDIVASLDDPPTRRLASGLLAQMPQEHFIPKIVKALQREMQPTIDRFDLYQSGLDLLPTPPPDFGHLLNLLNILSLLPVEFPLIPSIPIFSIAAFDNLECAQCLLQSLKLLATNSSAKVVDITPIVGDLARAMIRRQELAPEVEPDDLLCAVLALYTASDVSEALCTTRICGECLRSCHCISKSVTEHLVTEYNARAEEEDGTSGLIAGYIALILARILIKLPAQQKRILPLLPGTSRKEKISKILSRLDVLQDLQVLIERHTLGEADSDDEDILRGAISGLKSML